MGIFSFIYKIYTQQSRRKLFFDICKNNKIDINYLDNIDETIILKEIFFDRCYADYFPFYQNAVIVDIGAHKGYFSIFASKNSGNESRIIAVEPFEDNLKVLQNNLAENNIKNVEIIKKGIYSENKMLDLFIAKSENNSIFDNYNKYLNSENIDTLKIEVLTIEKLLDECGITDVDFMKIDCEGAEYPSLFSCSPNTLKKIKTLSIEFHDLKNEKNTGLKLIAFLELNSFKIVKFIHESTIIDNNFGKIVATRA